MQFGIVNSKGKNIKIQDTIGKLIAINSEDQTQVELETCSTSNETFRRRRKQTKGRRG
jgi:hypothetical protein